MVCSEVLEPGLELAAIVPYFDVEGGPISFVSEDEVTTVSEDSKVLATTGDTAAESQTPLSENKGVTSPMDNVSDG